MEKTCIPLYATMVKAGFPSPADDFIDKELDLNDYLIPHPISTFFVKVSGDSMIGSGIFPGDILVVDKSISFIEDKIIIAYLNGEFTVKIYETIKGQPFLIPSNPKYSRIEIYENSDFLVWGVVTSVIHKF